MMLTSISDILPQCQHESGKAGDRYYAVEPGKDETLSSFMLIDQGEGSIHWIYGVKHIPIFIGKIGCHPFWIKSHGPLYMQLLLPHFRGRSLDTGRMFLPIGIDFSAS